MREFRRLVVWQRSHALVLSCYRVTAGFPRDELYGLTSQIRRASASIPTNIAEGCGRWSDSDFARFLGIAFGSASELEYLLLLARDLGLMTESEYEPLHSDTSEVKRMLAGLLRRLVSQPER